MPFTLAHPAAAIPLWRPLGRFGVLSALVIGSMAPDFVYYLPLGIVRHESHSLGGLAWFCLPAGLLAYASFHGLMRPATMVLLPPAMCDRLTLAPRSRGLSAVLGVVLSILVGASTHVLWDGFTHGSGFFVQQIWPLQEVLWSFPGYPVYAFKVLQHGGTIVGLTLLAVWVRRWYLATSPHPSPGAPQLSQRTRRAAQLALLGTSILVGVLAGWMRADGSSGALAFQHFAVRGAIGTTGALAALLLIVGVVYRLREARNRTTQ